MKLSDILSVLEEIAPTRFAESWDNVGLLVGDPLATISRVLLTIDYTPAVADEARNAGCDLIIAYHPPIFHPIKRLGPDSLIYDAARRDVAIYSPHTALDVAEGGTNDMLADALELSDRVPLRLAQGKPTHYKLVVFVPEDDLEDVSQAIFAAGAGRLGDYSQCSFRTPGTGTFFGHAGASPAIGRPGRLEQVEEFRLESIVPIDRAAEVVGAMRQAHPYEEPAFDLIQLAPIDQPRGIGRLGRISTVTSAQKLIEQVKKALGIDHLLTAGPLDKAVETAAVCAGACGDLLEDAIAAGADLYLTGEIRHHDAVRAASAGMAVFCTLHSNSERAVLPRLADRLAARLPDLPLKISDADRDPFTVQ